MQFSVIDFEFIRVLVLKHSGIELTPDKAYLAEARLLTLARRENFTSLAHLVDVLRRTAGRDLLQKVIEAVTVNETSFFRDASPFEALRKSILPDLLARAAKERRLAIWCGACSTGQEPYSIALLLREHFPEIAGAQVRILATDICSEVLSKASKGVFTQLEVNRGLPAALLAKHFRSVGTEWQIKEELRGMVEFTQLNLADSWPAMPAFDVVFLRNVLIYFSAETKKVILDKVKSVLRPDGYLFLGSSESLMGLDESLERILIAGTCCFRPKGNEGKLEMVAPNHVR